jgi:hypothetical protein
MSENGQPPHMIVSQNATTTDRMVAWASIGSGGPTRPPMVTQSTVATTAATTAVSAR